MDNQSAVMILRKRSGPTEVSDIIHKVNDILLKYNIHMRWAYIPSKLNVIADVLSRGDIVCSAPTIVVDASVLRSIINVPLHIVVGCDEQGRLARYLANSTAVKYFSL